jgi:hypothetical protein
MLIDENYAYAIARARRILSNPQSSLEDVSNALNITVYVTQYLDPYIQQDETLQKIWEEAVNKCFKELFDETKH